MGLLRKNCPHCRGKLETGQRIHISCIYGYAEARQAKKERADAKAEWPQNLSVRVPE